MTSKQPGRAEMELLHRLGEEVRYDRKYLDRDDPASIKRFPVAIENPVD